MLQLSQLTVIYMYYFKHDYTNIRRIEISTKYTMNNMCTNIENNRTFQLALNTTIRKCIIEGLAVFSACQTVCCPKSLFLCHKLNE